MPSATTTISIAGSADHDDQQLKRQKRSAVTAGAVIPLPPKRRSRIFAPFRTIGLIAPTPVPFSVDPRGKTTFNITTSVGKSLQTFDLRRGLHLIFLTRPQTPENITAICHWRNHTLAAWGDGVKEKRAGANNGVWVYMRGKKTGELQRPVGKCETITQLLALGTWIIGCGKTTIQVWSSATFEHHTTIRVGQGRSDVSITGGICNMPTFLNKILVGTSDGCVEIWNVSTGKLRYTIEPDDDSVGSVTVVEPTPALSLFAIAYSSGEVIIQDVRKDEPVISLLAGTQAAPITSISFRSDGLGAGDDGRKEGVMATASSAHGDITFWDLNNGGKKMGALRGAHAPPSTKGTLIGGGISSIQFLPGQAVIVSSGMDNALRTWLFDKEPFSPIPRFLHARSGHAAPVVRLKFLPAASDGAEEDGKWLMTASRDRSLWGWSLRRDAQSTEISQGAIKSKAKKLGILNSSLAEAEGNSSLEDLKAPQIISVACSLNRDGGMGALPGNREMWVRPELMKSTKNTASSFSGWESVVTAHENDQYARTWLWGRKRAGRWKLPSLDSRPVSSVAVTACGTFALIGSEGGSIVSYNLQSGAQRQRFPAPITKTQASDRKSKRSEELIAHTSRSRIFQKGEGRHTGSVTGIEIDSLNQTVISVGMDGKVKFWDFGSGILQYELDWSLTSINGLRYHRSTDLIAVSCDDSSLRVIDIVTKKLVREFWGCEGKILDFAFSNDGRWVMAVAEDSILRVWDLPTGHLVEAVRFRSKVTALAFSPTGEYLATAHEGSVGVNIWNNRTLFTHVPTRQISSDDITDIDAPSASGENVEAVVEAAFADEDVNDEDVSSHAPLIDQLSKDLLTLSLVPKARWQTLLHLDAIRARNKPKEAPKAPEKAPFFLPSLDKSRREAQDAQNATALTTLAADSQNITSSRISNLTAEQQATASSAFTALIRTSPSQIVPHLASLPPSAADLAIRTLDPSPPYEELVAFIEALTNRLREKRDYELCQTYMSVLLRCHGSLVLESEEVRAAMTGWEEASKMEVKRLGELVGFCKGVGGWIGGVI